MTVAARETGPSQATILSGALFALLLWSGTAIANKAAVGHMDAMTAGVLRSLLAGLIAWAIVLLLRLARPTGARQWSVLAISGFASFAFWPMLLSLGLGRTTANHAALIMALLPIFTGLIAALVDRRLPSRWWWFGVAVAFAGTIALFATRADGGVLTGGGDLTGDLIVLSGVGICAVGYVAGGRLSVEIGAPSTAFWGLAIAVLVQLPVFLLLMGRTDWAAVGAGGWAAIGYMTILSSIVGYSLWFWSLGRGRIARISALQFSQPILTIALAAPILGESITWGLVGSGAVILAGVALTQRAPR